MINGEVGLQSSKGLQILADLVAPSTFGIGSVKYFGFDYFFRQANNGGEFLYLSLELDREDMSQKLI